MSRRLIDTCRLADQHTLGPADYMAWDEWADEMSKTHRQVRCAGCGLFLVWERIPVPVPEPSEGEK